MPRQCLRSDLVLREEDGFRSCDGNTLFCTKIMAVYCQIWALLQWGRCPSWVSLRGRNFLSRILVNLVRCPWGQLLYKISHDFCRLVCPFELVTSYWNNCSYQDYTARLSCLQERGEQNHGPKVHHRKLGNQKLGDSGRLGKSPNQLCADRIL